MDTPPNTPYKLQSMISPSTPSRVAVGPFGTRYGFDTDLSVHVGKSLYGSDFQRELLPSIFNAIQHFRCVRRKQVKKDPINAVILGKTSDFPFRCVIHKIGIFIVIKPRDSGGLTDVDKVVWLQCYDKFDELLQSTQSEEVHRVFNVLFGESESPNADDIQRAACSLKKLFGLSGSEGEAPDEVSEEVARILERQVKELFKEMPEERLEKFNQPARTWRNWSKFLVTECKKLEVQPGTPEMLSRFLGCDIGQKTGRATEILKQLFQPIVFQSPFALKMAREKVIPERNVFAEAALLIKSRVAGQQELELFDIPITDFITSKTDFSVNMYWEQTLSAVKFGQLLLSARRLKRTAKGTLCKVVLPAEKLATAVSDAAKVVAILHRVGLVHRDIKSRNILIGQEGQPGTITDYCLGGTPENGDSVRVRGISLSSDPSMFASLVDQRAREGRQGRRHDVHAFGRMLLQDGGILRLCREVAQAVNMTKEIAPLYQVARAKRVDAFTPGNHESENQVRFSRQKLEELDKEFPMRAILLPGEYVICYPELEVEVTALLDIIKILSKEIPAKEVLLLQNLVAIGQGCVQAEHRWTMQQTHDQLCKALEGYEETVPASENSLSQSSPLSQGDPLRKKVRRELNYATGEGVVDSNASI